jgi:uncharacterized protein (DUF58 family)
VRYQAPRIAVLRQLQGDWAQVGDTLSEHWTVQNGSWLPLLWLDLEDASELPGYTARRVAAADPHGSQGWTTNAVCSRRGVYTLGPLQLRLGDPFGVFEYTRREGGTKRIVIYPPLAQLPPLPVPRGQRGGLARADLIQQYATPSVGGIREYRPGDVPSHIHWPTVARRNILMVKEFDQERAGAVWIVLDLSAAAYGVTIAATPDDGPPPVIPQLEAAIVIAASLVAQLLAEGRSVGLVADDSRERRVAPGQGQRQLWAILGELADAEASGATTLATLLRRPHRGGALAVITPDASGTWLGPLAEVSGRGGALALLVTPSGEPPAARAAAAALAGFGVPTRIFPADIELPRVSPPRPKDEIRISPMGRAVRVPGKR